jgi:hypothetical protein
MFSNFGKIFEFELSKFCCLKPCFRTFGISSNSNFRTFQQNAATGEEQSLALARERLPVDEVAATLTTQEEEEEEVRTVIIMT